MEETIERTEPTSEISEEKKEEVSVTTRAEENVKKRWYVVHTQSGFENKVQANLEKRIKTMGFQDKVFRILIPTEEVAEMRDGKRKIMKRKFFPGYVLVEMEEQNKEALHIIRNTPGVTNFVGAEGPQPLRDEEVKQILKQMGMFGEVEKPKVKPKLELERGESVRITDGPFRDFVGIVDEVNPERGKLKVMVTIFGRSAPVELDFLQVSKL